MSRSVPGVIRQARGLLAGGHCQLHLHRRRKGGDQYCAQAALSMAATGVVWPPSVSPLLQRAYDVLEPLAREMDPSIGPEVAAPLSLFNDTHPQADVLALFDRGIRSATK